MKTNLTSESLGRARDECASMLLNVTVENKFEFGNAQKKISVTSLENVPWKFLGNRIRYAIKEF